MILKGFGRRYASSDSWYRVVGHHTEQGVRDGGRLAVYSAFAYCIRTHRDMVQAAPHATVASTSVIQTARPHHLVVIVTLHEC
jgi:hypothetical protein